LREEERKLIAKIELVKDGERSDEHSKVNSLITAILDEKAALVTTLKNKKAALQECVVNYKISVAEHRWVIIFSPILRAGRGPDGLSAGSTSRRWRHTIRSWRNWNINGGRRMRLRRLIA
jgi:hypothetical protein